MWNCSNKFPFDSCNYDNTTSTNYHILVRYRSSSTGVIDLPSSNKALKLACRRGETSGAELTAVSVSSALFSTPSAAAGVSLGSPQFNPEQNLSTKALSKDLLLSPKR